MEEFGQNCFEEQEDGRLLFHADYTSAENLLSWLLTFGDQVELKSPKRAAWGNERGGFAGWQNGMKKFQTAMRGGKNMKYDWMDAYVLKKRGVTKDFQPVWNWIRYQCGWENVCGHLSGSEKESLLHYPEADLKKRVEHLKGVYKDGI